MVLSSEGGLNKRNIELKFMYIDNDEVLQNDKMSLTRRKL